ncbi:MAG: hypothetical protein HQK53_19595, partial [Oligoflexia bacterium]|nr:hypothetical protein [Oligoflexia bacterium]
PYTTDYELIKSRLRALVTTLDFNAGTNIEASLMQNLGPQVVVFSDGENSVEGIGAVSGIESGIEREVTRGPAIIMNNKLVFFVLGSIKGGKIPIKSSGQEIYGYKKDEKGEEIISKINVTYIAHLMKKFSKNLVIFTIDQADENKIIQDTGHFFLDRGTEIVIHDLGNLSYNKFFNFVLKIRLGIMGFILIIISYILFYRKAFVVPRRYLLGIFIFLLSLSIVSSEVNAGERQENDQNLIERNQTKLIFIGLNGKIDVPDCVKDNWKTDPQMELANCYIIKNELKNAKDIYVNIYEKSLTHMFNYGTLLLLEGDVAAGILTYKRIETDIDNNYERLKKNTDLSNLLNFKRYMKKNIMLSIINDSSNDSNKERSTVIPTTIAPSVRDIALDDYEGEMQKKYLKLLLLGGSVSASASTRSTEKNNSVSNKVKY